MSTKNKWLTGYTLLDLNKAKSSDTEVPFWDINLSISNGTISAKNYDERDEFDFGITIVIFTFLDGDVPQHTSYEVYRHSVKS